MAEATHYRVKVRETFVAANETFVPAGRYVVRRSVYEGLDDEGRKFKSLCITAVPLFRAEE